MNRLANSSSPYLKQHSTNPVDWYPWGSKAFEKAEKEDKLIFLSIGYSTCHWCHVMERESFENSEIAALMNRDYVSVKVDREQRPDIDAQFMTTAHILGSKGGWPLTIILTPAARAFYAATYIPAEGRGRQAGMKQLLPGIAGVWKNDRQKIKEASFRIEDTLKDYRNKSYAGGETDTDYLEQYINTKSESFDTVHGGFGISPKFPSPLDLQLLLTCSDVKESDRALFMVKQTMDGILRGGINDHVEGGFHRYATDRQWFLPHFEKMLYDQAQILKVLALLWHKTGTELYREAFYETTGFLEKHLKHNNLYYSALDADDPAGEGIYYQWTWKELESLLSENHVSLLKQNYGLTPEGNVRDEATGIPTGSYLISENAAVTREIRKTFHEKIKPSLIVQRRNKEAPSKDTKILTSWNALLVESLALSAALMNDRKLKQMAIETGQAILDDLTDSSGHLYRYTFEGTKGGPSFSDDYSYSALAFLELFKITSEPLWLKQTLNLSSHLHDHFYDSRTGLYLISTPDSTRLDSQPDFQDSVIPSATSTALRLWAGLFHITGNTVYRDRADNLEQAMGWWIQNHPEAIPSFLSGLTEHKNEGSHIIVTGKEGQRETDQIISLIAAHAVYTFIPHRGQKRQDLVNLNRSWENYTLINDKPAVYICRNGVCNLPLTDIEEIKKAIP